MDDPINNLTRPGDVPKWNTIRQRHWKNEAYYNTHMYTVAELERMQRGLAPNRLNDMTGKWESMELHHMPPQRDGGLFDFEPMWPEDHARVDNYRKLGD